MIDFRSETYAQPPTQEMRERARDAETGHAGHRLDPTVSDLDREVADRLGMDDAIFVPSGTMANQIAARVHTDPGQEVLAEAESHIVNLEHSGLGQLSGLQPRPLDGGERGVPTAEQVRENCRSRTIYNASTGLLALENTHSARGGLAIEPERIDAAAAAAAEHDVPVHLDGARLFHAATALDVPASRLSREVDSVYVDLAKIGAPAGAMLAGSESFVEKAVYVRQAFGGHMERVGMLAAPALVALSNLDTELPAVLERAERLAEGLDACTTLDAPSPETNLVYVDSSDAGLTGSEFVDLCETGGIHPMHFGGEHVTRFALHREITDDDVEATIDYLQNELA
jgi:threonine aldolase